METILREYLPHAPGLGLYAAPDIPSGKLQAAIRDYGKDIHPPEVLGLYDATRLGTGRDGALFLSDRFVFQNNRLHTPISVRYEDVVGVRSKRLLLGGRRVEVDFNRARATVTEAMDFSGQPAAAGFVEILLREAMLRAPRAGESGKEERPRARTGPEGETDREALDAALRTLRAEGKLSAPDDRALREAVGL